jgi:methyl-accepting chemotaxis protein
MMTLIKKSQIGKHTALQDDIGSNLSTTSTVQAEAQKRKARTFARQQKAAERIAAATNQLASGITEAASAAEEMRRASDQIASGAEEAAGAAQQSLKAVSQGSALILQTKSNADSI